MNEMEVSRKRPYQLILSLVFLMLVFNSCANQEGTTQASKDLASIAIDNLPNAEPKTKATSGLDFTSDLRSIFEDSKGNFWFGSHKEGVCRFDGETFTYFTKKDGLISHQIRTIQEDQKGTIWFGTDNGVSYYDGEKMTSYSSEGGDSRILIPEGEWQKNPGDLWFNGGNRRGVYRYDGERMSYLAFPIPANSDDQNPHFVTGIAKGKNDKVWFATYPGVIGFAGQSSSEGKADLHFLNKGNDQLHVRSIFEDSKGNLWIGNNGIGVLFYDGETIINFTEKKGLGISFMGQSGSLGRIFAIAEDHLGNIWFGSRDNGAWKYDGQSLTNYTAKDGLTSNMVWEIYEDKRNDLWLGLADGSVCKFNGKSFDKVFNTQ